MVQENEEFSDVGGNKQGEEFRLALGLIVIGSLHMAIVGR
jgi:hypothetical protein